MDNNNKDVEMATVPATGTDNTDSSKDKPPTPPKRDFKAENKVEESDSKRKSTRIFPRPEVIYKPESTKSWMSCLKNLLIIFNFLIWVFGAALTGIGVWIKVDPDLWEIQTGLNLKQFSTAGIILIVAGVVIMVIGFLGCYGALSESLCMLVLYVAVVVIIILMEIAVIALVWTAIGNKDVKEEVKSKVKKAMQEMVRDDVQQHFINLMQTKLKCCGVDGPDDYIESSIPLSCTNSETGYPFEKGCLETAVEYMKGKASLVGGVAAGVFLLQVAAIVLTLCVACGIKNAASNAIF